MMTNSETLMDRMTDTLQQFIERKVSAPAFVSSFQSLWVQWRDSEERSSINDRQVLDAYDRAFTAADSYKPDTAKFRLNSDIDEVALRSDISEILRQLSGS
jgi:hypothetical protein